VKPLGSLIAAIAFLTRLPVGRLVACDAADVARSAGWFPLVGILMGVLNYVAVAVLKDHLPAGIVAVLLVALDAVMTGALHYDGLADSADGFGGGRTPDDVLRIMRDHAIGSYGGVALALVIGLKATAYAALVQGSARIAAFIFAPALGRWSILLLTATLPYARTSESVIGWMGKWSLVSGAFILLIALAVAASPRAWIAGGAVVAVTTAFGFFCRHRIGGITGDTLGANLQLCECAALLTFLWTGWPQ
jgi:adenosylcobinamide-GDP ribazoletransferase